ncbi:MAG: hypothetical protein IKX36_09525 [Prevotella sp.]|nr:hypothetical protein [Prevotella sp.]
MYDKVKFWIDRAIVGEQFPSIVNLLDEANTQVNQRTGEVKTFGSLGGLRVAVFIGGVSIVGSLAKFLHNGSNVYPLDRHTTAQALEKLGDALHFQIGDAKVTGLEFGNNFIMRYDVAAYLSRLGAMPRMCRLNINPTSLYYRGNGKQQPKIFAFYDKVADATNKGMDCPEDLRGANMLRYEMRLKGRLSQQLGVSVTASTLNDERFYRMLVRLYQDNYFSISKTHKIKSDSMSEIRTVKDAFSLFVSRLINEADQATVTGFIDEMKAAGVFEDRKNYTRLAKKLQEVAAMADLTEPDELINELDDEIKNSGAYW